MFRLPSESMRPSISVLMSAVGSSLASSPLSSFTRGASSASLSPPDPLLELPLPGAPARETWPIATHLCIHAWMLN